MKTGEVLIALKTIGTFTHPICSQMQAMPNGGCDFMYCSQCVLSCIFTIEEAVVLRGLRDQYATH